MSTRDIIISNRRIGEAQPCFIIAEVGQNHQGDINIAKELIKAAKLSGADCVKFQKSCLNEKFNQCALMRPYKNINSWGETYGEHKAFLEFSDKEFIELQEYSRKLDILFTASAMDNVSLKFLNSIQVPFIKIGSGDADNIPLIEEAAKLNCPLIISTGMQTMDSVKCIYETVRNVHLQFAILQCTSSYPTPFNHIHLNVIKEYKQHFPDIQIGYSGHEIGTAVTIAAVALGAKVIERHLTLNKLWKGSDHTSSLVPAEFQAMVHGIRQVEQALGGREKQFQESEQVCFSKLGKSLVASRFIDQGTTLKFDDIKIKVAEPKGISAKDLQSTLGKQLARQVRPDESIELSDLVR